MGSIKNVKPHLVTVAEADEQHGQDLDDVRLEETAQLVRQALKGQQGACVEVGRGFQVGVAAGTQPLTF